MKAFFNLIRYKNLVLLCLSIVCFDFWRGVFDIQSLYLALTIVLIAAGGYIINDIEDVEIDRVNKPNTYIVSRLINKQQAWLFYGLLNVAGLGLSCLVFPWSLIGMHILVITLLYAYAVKYKQEGLMGNVLVAFLCALVPGEYLYIYWNRYTDIQLIVLGNYIVFAFCTTLLRELVKDLEDREGDALVGAKTYPLVKGEKKANQLIARIVYFVLLQYIFLFCFSWSSLTHMLIIGTLSVLLLIGFYYYTQSSRNRKTYKRFSLYLKLYILLGLLSLFIL